jgi:hypothetical protein
LYFIKDWVNFEIKLKAENLAIWKNYNNFGKDLISGRKRSQARKPKTTNCRL